MKEITGNHVIGVSRAVFISLIVAACCLIAVPPLAAQQSQQSQQGQQGQQGQQYDYQQQSQGADDFSEKDLEKFAKAKSEVDEIRTKYSDALGRVDEPEKARKLQDKYGQQMVESIRDRDLSVEKYNQISRAMQGNPDLKEKVDTMAN